jgi:hypothetical protein
MSLLRAKETTLGRISWTVTRTTFDFWGMFTHISPSPCRVSDPQIIVRLGPPASPIPSETFEGRISVHSSINSPGKMLPVISSIHEMSSSSVPQASNSLQFSQN